jgi:Uma2 family endonuclease
LLIIEVANSSLSYDQEIKLPLYAEAGISHYWIFNLIEHLLTVYREPYQTSQGKHGYGIKHTILPDQASALPSLSNSLLDLSKIFPII